MTPLHSRRRRRRAYASAVSAAILAAVAACGGPPQADDAAATPVASTDADAPSGAESPSASASPSAKTSPSAGASNPGAAADAAPAQPSATGTPQPEPGVASLAGRIRPGVTYEGVATHYEAEVGDGACLFGPSPDMMIAAMNHTDYESAKACGAYVRVHAANGASVTVRITNECPLPCAPGQLDLSREAFAELDDIRRGRMPITWSLLSPSTSDTISIRYKDGSSRWWCGVQAIDHRNPVARLEVRTSSGWRELPRTDYNYFISADGTGCGSAIRLTDIYGEQLVVDQIALEEDLVQSTRVQFARH